MNPRSPRTAAPVLVALLATACASVPPAEPPELPVEVPAEWGAPPAAEPVPDLPEDGWWEGLGDERLPELIAEALAHNRDLTAAAARVEAAAAQARIAGADALPQASGRFDAARRRQNFLGFPIPGGERQVLSTTTTSLQTALDVSWELDLWGRLSAAEGAALARLQASRAELAAARLSLAGQTAKAWFGAREAAAQAALADATLENRKLFERRVRRRYESGLVPPLELRLASSERASTEALAAERRRQLDAARRRLELLLGRYPDGDLATGNPEATGEAADARPGAAVPPDLLDVSLDPVPTGLPAELLGRRPDLAAAERRVAAAGLGVDEAEAALLPRISLTGSAGRSSQELEDLLDNDFTVWSLAAGLLQPIFQGGRLRAAVDLAEAREREALAGYVTAALAAFSEVEGALADERHLARRAEALAEAAHQAQAARDLSQDRYAAGLADYLSVLESQRRALDAESGLISARRQRLDARVDLVLALGGGFEGGGSDGPGAAGEPPGDGGALAPSTARAAHSTTAGAAGDTR